MVSRMFDCFWSFVRCLGVSAMALFGCSLWAACSDGGSGETGAGGGTSEGRLYVISARLTTGPEAGAFAIVVDSLDAGTEADFSTSIEIPNGGLVVGPPGGEVMYAVDGAAPRLTEFRLTPDGTFERGETLSLQNVSFTTTRAAAGNFIFFSDTKAYVVDTFTQTIIIWDPSMMVITGTIDLSAIGIPGEAALIGNQPLERGEELVFAIEYLGLGMDGQLGFAPESKLVFMDPSTDTINEVVAIEDCGSVGSTFLDDQGDLFAASDFSGITTRLVGDRGGPECVVRVPAGTYDVEDYTLLTDRTGGMFAGSMYRSRDTLTYFRVLDLSLLPDEAATTGEISSARAWFWGELDVAADEPMRLLVDIPANAAPSTGYTVDGEDWITETDAGFSGTTLINISGNNFRRGLFVPASILNVFRLR